MMMLLVQLLFQLVLCSLCIPEKIRGHHSSAYRRTSMHPGNEMQLSDLELDSGGL